VTISLRRFMGKMASVRQILPCQPGKHPLSDLYGPDRLPHPYTGSPVIPAVRDPLGTLAESASERDLHGARGLNRGPGLFYTASIVELTLSQERSAGHKENKTLFSTGLNFPDTWSGSGSKISDED